MNKSIYIELIQVKKFNTRVQLYPLPNLIGNISKF